MLTSRTGLGRDDENHQDLTLSKPMATNGNSSRWWCEFELEHIPPLLSKCLAYRMCTYNNLKTNDPNPKQPNTNPMTIYHCGFKLKLKLILLLLDCIITYTTHTNITHTLRIGSSSLVVRTQSPSGEKQADFGKS